MNVRPGHRAKIELFSAAMGAVAMLAIAGCGSVVKVVPVMGTVTFGSKPPPHPCTVSFLPLGVDVASNQGENGMHGATSGVGECNTAGEYAARCLRDRSGLMPGRYEVLISCYLPNKDVASPPVSVVPTGFKAPDLVVPADAGSVRYDVDVPVANKK